MTNSSVSKLLFAAVLGTAVAVGSSAMAGPAGLQTHSAGSVAKLANTQAPVILAGRKSRRKALIGGLIAGAIVGGIIANSHSHEREVIVEERPRARGLPHRHLDYCYRKFRSYREWDNSYQPYDTYGRRECLSPYYN